MDHVLGFVLRFVLDETTLKSLKIEDKKGSSRSITPLENDAPPTTTSSVTRGGISGVTPQGSKDDSYIKGSVSKDSTISADAPGLICNLCQSELEIAKMEESDPVMFGFLKCCFIISGLASDTPIHGSHYKNTLNFWDIAPTLASEGTKGSDGTGSLFISCENTNYDAPWIEFEFTSHLCKLTHYRFGGVDVKMSQNSG